MDTTDQYIDFDNSGVCNHCLEFEEFKKPKWFPNEEGEKKLEHLFSVIKNEGKNKEYDCILGLSGGLDSSYVAILAKKYGLRPLVFHVDAGWNSELAVYNIEKVVEYCNYDLVTHIMDWNEIKDLQRAYLRSGVANQDVVQDHSFVSILYHYTNKHRIKYVLNGSNIATESVFPPSWHHDAMDSINLKAIHKKYGEKKLKHFKPISFFQYYFWYPMVMKMTVFHPLNLVYYNPKEVKEFLIKNVGYKPYGRKHGESRFTKFFQNYFLVKKFGYDKRKIHLSSMILSNLITRDEAIDELEKPLYDNLELNKDKAFVAKKLGFTVEELDNFISKDNGHYSNFPNWDSRYKLLKKLQDFIVNYTPIKLNTYYKKI
tara:strand:- start:12985 stop:14100 length:1116 start_codon:yes stop_codon:yes gene_type:complete